MSDYQRVLLTGAAGALGSELRKSGTRLGKVVRLSARGPCENLAPHEEDFPLDLADFDAVSAAVKGCDAIVHMGGQALEGPWQTILDSNIVGGYNIYEAARRHGVKRIVYASSVHAIGYYERTQTIDGNVPTRPDSLYGVSKTFVENLARYYFDKFGIETVCLRIGSSFPEPTDRRHLITWLSYRDCRQLVEKSLSAPRVGFMIAYGMSNNSEAFWDNRTAAVLGYKPEDSADDYRDKVFAKTTQGDPNDPAVRFQGGSFCAAGHFEDENK
ncbi:dTDP-glucose 4,6-dehydratase (plasmid) [Sinorhizobium fredii NGR234]|uniref:dTDP-glucose 4,6-dehydratase n=1 Tax=Sinorhizobium fredii (strain NBRC 101917 / NGR234) TaxID=394 RepID=C3KNW3_SINFN|nr:NAD(P)-dependent oxidoreductase [Sinorhizobium fredii]ACP21771.1 dTDP-glucose 4,6-dehydratase [Sinorhizobium fredii NGR234]